jgi:ribonuclease R
MKEKLLAYFRAADYQPQGFDEIIHDLGLEDDRQEVKTALKELISSYEIAVSKKGKYILPEDAGIYTGQISIRNPEYGFIACDLFERDLYVAKADFNGAMDKDVVVFQLKSPLASIRAMYREAKVLLVKQRGLKFVVGELARSREGYIIRLDRDDAESIKITNPEDYQLGDIVKVAITSYAPLAGRIVERIGIKNDIGIDILTIAAEFDFSDRFPEDVLRELETLPQDISKEARKRRKPTLTTIMTIDGADAKDLDDAVGVKRLDNGNYLLGVYIADVSYYVRAESAIDMEARNRGTSVYLVNRVLPMLPPLLSNNLCSLNPQTDKLVIACEMEINPEGEVVNSDIFPSAIKTKYRMTYDAVNEIIAGNPEQREKYRDICEDIDLMLELKGVLNAMRVARGALEFDVDEGKVIVDDKGRPRDVVLVARGEGERIIEEFMLAANETVASAIYYLELPFIYRVHDDPDVGKMETFRRLAANLGYRSFKRRVNARQLQEFLANLREQDSYLKVLLLRAMAKAIYSEKNGGHFGLGSRCYTHFTSPIRRYPDLLVHRLLRKYLFEQDINRDEWTNLMEEIAAIADLSSKRERDAMECEYRVNDMKKAEYMADYVGERFEGVVSGVTRFGLFVMLPNTIEGFVHISTLKGYYEYDGETMRLVGPGGHYHLGSKVLVEVIRADKKSREIDFKIVYNSNKVKGNGKRRRPKQKGRA